MKKFEIGKTYRQGCSMITDLEKELDYTYFELEDMRESLPPKTFQAFEGYMLAYIQDLTKQINDLRGG
jgi:hypothetical protein